jgi:hypothetical protein
MINYHLKNLGENKGKISSEIQWLNLEQISACFSRAELKTQK